MPWRPRYSEQEARAAIEGATSWAEVIDALGYGYFGKNIQTIRRWAAKWGIPVNHLPDNRAGRAVRHRASAAEVEWAIATSFSWAGALRQLGQCDSGGNWKSLKRRASELNIDTGHFDRHAASRESRRRGSLSIESILVQNSRYNRTSLKRRLYESGLKTPRCELCGQDDTWRGKSMSLILDHINGVRDDNRLKNLRIVCPNCAATLDTHCGRKNRMPPREPRDCARCGASYSPGYSGQRYCSRYCGTRWDRSSSRGRKRIRERPPAEVLLREVDELGYLAVGRKYRVSDNAIRKWLLEYERERLTAEGRDPAEANIPKGTWPNRRRS